MTTHEWPEPIWFEELYFACAMGHPAIALETEEEMSTTEIQPGSRVRYRYAHRDTGTVVRRKQGTVTCWWVRWDHDPHGPRLLDAYEENLELIDESSPVEASGPDGTRAANK